MIENNKTQVQFQLCKTKANLGTPAAGTIVFIQDSKELYLDDVYYGLSKTDAATLAKAVEDISSLNGSVNGLTTISNSLLAYVKNLRKFADGADANSTEGPVLTTHDSGVLTGKTNVKDAIDALAAAVDTLTGHTWTAVTKPGDAGQFATSVKQKTDGSIEVSYANVMSTDVKRTTEQQASIAGATVEAALETLKGKAAAAQAKADANASAIGVINGTGNGSISKAVSDAKSELMGSGANVWVGDEAKTLTHLRELIKTNADTIGNLTKLDTDKANQISKIIDELRQVSDNEEGSFANTLLDKLLVLYGSGEYTVNGGKQTTLQDIINAIENKITTGDTAVTNNITTEINKLDATKRGQLTDGDALETGKHVGVKVVEENGKLTEVKVVENDIASAEALTNLTSTVTELSGKVDSQGSQLTWKVIS